MNYRFTEDSLNWRRLCRSAALEQNPEKLYQIVQKISSALRARQRSLRRLYGTRRDRRLAPLLDVRPGSVKDTTFSVAA